MEQRWPNTTAERAGLLRAAHQLLDTPRILDDPLALGLISRERAAALRTNPQAFERWDLRRLRASIAVRSRYVEDFGLIRTAFAGSSSVGSRREGSLPSLQPAPPAGDGCLHRRRRAASLARTGATPSNCSVTSDSSGASDGSLSTRIVTPAGGFR